jgi:hypothetical protein
MFTESEEFEELIDKIINRCSEKDSKKIFSEMIDRLKELLEI